MLSYFLYNERTDYSMAKTTASYGQATEHGAIATTPPVNITVNKDTKERTSELLDEKEKFMVFKDPASGTVTAHRDYSDIKVGAKQGNADIIYNKINDFKASVGLAAEGDKAKETLASLDKAGVQWEKKKLNIDGKESEVEVARVEGKLTPAGFDKDSLTAGRKVTNNEVGKQMMAESYKREAATQMNAMKNTPAPERANIVRKNVTAKIDDTMKRADAYEVTDDSIKINSSKNREGVPYSPAPVQRPRNISREVNNAQYKMNQPERSVPEKQAPVQESQPKQAPVKQAPAVESKTEIVPDAKIYMQQDKDGKWGVSVQRDHKNAKTAEALSKPEPSRITEYTGESADKFMDKIKDKPYKEMNIDGVPTRVMDVKNLPVTTSKNENNKTIQRQIDITDEKVQIEAATVKDTALDLDSKIKKSEAARINYSKELSAEDKTAQVSDIAARKRSENVTYSKDNISTNSSLTKSGNVRIIADKNFEPYAPEPVKPAKTAEASAQKSASSKFAAVASVPVAESKSASAEKTAEMGA